MYLKHLKKFEKFQGYFCEIFCSQIKYCKVHIFWEDWFCEISTIYLSYLVTVKSTMEISQNFVAFSEYMNFK